MERGKREGESKLYTKMGDVTETMTEAWPEGYYCTDSQDAVWALVQRTARRLLVDRAYKRSPPSSVSTSSNLAILSVNRRTLCWRSLGGWAEGGSNDWK